MGENAKEIKELGQDEVVSPTEANNTTFSLHQIYEKEGDTEQIHCYNCGSGLFRVGQGSHYTVVKCMRCQHEECIHDG